MLFEGPRFPALLCIIASNLFIFSDILDKFEPAVIANNSVKPRFCSRSYYAVVHVIVCRGLQVWLHYLFYPWAMALKPCGKGV